MVETITSRFAQAKEGPREMELKVGELQHSNANKEKLSRSDHTIHDLWNTIKRPHPGTHSRPGGGHVRNAEGTETYRMT